VPPVAVVVVDLWAVEVLVLVLEEDVIRPTPQTQHRETR